MLSGLLPDRMADRSIIVLTGVTGRVRMEEGAEVPRRMILINHVPLQGVTTRRDPTGLALSDHFGRNILGVDSEAECLSELKLFCLFSFFLTALSF